MIQRTPNDAVNPLITTLVDSLKRDPSDKTSARVKIINDNATGLRCFSRPTVARWKKRYATNAARRAGKKDKIFMNPPKGDVIKATLSVLFSPYVGFFWSGSMRR